MRCKGITKREEQCLNSARINHRCLMHYKILKDIKRRYLDFLIGGAR